jgi:hypothetical protein
MSLGPSYRRCVRSLLQPGEIDVFFQTSSPLEVPFHSLPGRTVKKLVAGFSHTMAITGVQYVQAAVDAHGDLVQAQLNVRTTATTRSPTKLGELAKQGLHLFWLGVWLFTPSRCFTPALFCRPYSTRVGENAATDPCIASWEQWRRSKGSRCWGRERGRFLGRVPAWPDTVSLLCSCGHNGNLAPLWQQAHSCASNVATCVVDGTPSWGGAAVTVTTVVRCSAEGVDDAAA